MCDAQAGLASTADGFGIPPRVVRDAFLLGETFGSQDETGKWEWTTTRRFDNAGHLGADRAFFEFRPGWMPASNHTRLSHQLCVESASGQVLDEPVFLRFEIPKGEQARLATSQVGEHVTPDLFRRSSRLPDTHFGHQALEILALAGRFR